MDEWDSSERIAALLPADQSPIRVGSRGKEEKGEKPKPPGPRPDPSVPASREDQEEEEVRHIDLVV